MKLLKVIGLLFGAAFLLVVFNDFFNPQYEADSMLILLLLLPLFIYMELSIIRWDVKKRVYFLSQ